MQNTNLSATDLGFQDLDSLETFVLRERGVDCTQYKDTFVRRRLVVRMRATQVGDIAGYLDVLRRDPKEIDALLDALSINLSYFYRDPAVFDVLRYTILDPMLSQRKACKSKSLAVWSAGCAGGEEPYSIAMTLCDLLSSDLPNWNLCIDATDVDIAVLDRAQAGRYSLHSFHDPNAPFVHRYFSRHQDKYHLNPSIRRMVTFRPHDINDPPPRSHYDLVLCRNVLIYFTREHQQKVVRHLVNHLASGGHLVLGMTEMLPMSIALSGDVKAVDGRLRVYRKTGEETSA